MCEMSCREVQPHSSVFRLSTVQVLFPLHFNSFFSFFFSHHNFSAGFFSLLGASQCTPCAAGTFSDALSATSCQSCIVGRFQDVAGQSLCKSCASSTFQSRNGTVTSCSPCPLDFSDVKRTLFFKDCRLCFNSSSTLETERSCCQGAATYNVTINASTSILVKELQNVINEAFFKQLGLPDFLVIDQDDLGWSLGDDSRKKIQLQIRYGGFQMLFRTSLDSFSEYLGFFGPVPAQGPTYCADASRKPTIEVGCVSCLSNFSIVSDTLALSLRSRQVPIFLFYSIFRSSLILSRIDYKSILL